jgi:hypothetical protein
MNHIGDVMLCAESALLTASLTNASGASEEYRFWRACVVHVQLEQIEIKHKVGWQVHAACTAVFPGGTSQSNEL